MTTPTQNKNRLRITEYLDLDLDAEQWTCNRCNRPLGLNSTRRGEFRLVSPVFFTFLHSISLQKY